MIAIGSTKKMVMGGWILAALFVVAYNGSLIVPLLAPPIAGYSHEVRSVISKQHQLEAQVSAARQSIKQVDLTGIAAIVDRQLGKKDEEGEAGVITPPPQAAASETNAEITEKETLLPQLQGIFGITDIHGNVKLLALLEGKILREKDQIGNFTVKRISEKGVMLTQDERSWFLQPPDVPFCFAREE